MEEMKPQDTVIYLLGELKGEMGSLKQSVDTSATSQASFNAVMREDAQAVKALLSNESFARQTADALLSERINTLETSRPTKHGWPIVWSSIAAFVSAIALIWPLFKH